MDPRITFVLALAEYDEDDSRPFKALRLRRERSGWRVGSAALVGRWAPLLIWSLEIIEIAPSSPLMVVFTDDEATAKRVQTWGRIEQIRGQRYNEMQGPREIDQAGRCTPRRCQSHKGPICSSSEDPLLAPRVPSLSESAHRTGRIARLSH
jgi:hypothetical protein